MINKKEVNEFGFLLFNHFEWTQHVVLKSATDIDTSDTGNTEKMVEDSWVWVSVWIIDVEWDIFFE